MPGSAEDIGLSFVSLTLVFASAALIRGWSRPLRALFIPTAVIAGFLIVALGPEGVGRLLGGPGVFSTETFAVWKALPGLLINVMCTALLLGERLPSLKTIWSISGTHVIMAGIMSAGQFAVASLLVLLLLEPVFGFSSKGGALIEMSFAGGHGTLAGLAPVLIQYGADDLLEVGLGLATVGMVIGIIVGTMLVNYAVRSPSIPVARQRPTSPDEDLDIDHHLPKPDDEPMGAWYGMTQVTAAAVFLDVSIAVGIALLDIFCRAFNIVGSDFFDKFPLFPFTIVGGVLVQLCAVRMNSESLYQPPGRRRAGRARDRRHRCLCDRAAVHRCARPPRRPLSHPGGRVRRMECPGDHDHRPSSLPRELVRAFAGRVRRIAGQRGDRIRDGRHGRSATQDRRRQRLQLSAAHHTADHRRRLPHRALHPSHRVVGASGIHDRGRRRDPDADALGNPAGNPR